jgi:hypothetical protein
MAAKLGRNAGKAVWRACRVSVVMVFAPLREKLATEL